MIDTTFNIVYLQSMGQPEASTEASTDEPRELETVSRNPGVFQRGADPRRFVPFPGYANNSAKRQAAREILLEKADLIATALVKQATNDVDADPSRPACALCGHRMPLTPDQQHRAIVAVLDRIGVGPQSKLELPEGVTRITKIESVIIDARGDGDR